MTRMMIGNTPKNGPLIEKKRYWHISIGRDAVPSRFFEGGWRAFEFIVFKPYEKLVSGEAHPYSFRLAFAFWFPFYIL